ncbi:hypothetical protein M427DRAFT_63398 [Gonapodya prolifera JEL478]|uniref:DUF1648 domain-containing protein n=1 Tax=Gonapodya prolifera (strain JEL478) TaxID=1344416 RepID=A0A138ZZE1_GONPJ|nr:hypothetical protein M427DRAFT_63398 [Gonapodya prolifera JEL478]|eukprot:KXS09860.1 hypothetical protein M427DRAFT_63398 [Gonapodya prolifera JEL478]
MAAFLRSLPLLLITALLSLIFADALSFYPKLPDRVPIHWDTAGKPDSWSSKETLLGIFVGISFGTAVVILAIVLSLKRIPIDFINLPVGNGDKQFLKGHPVAYAKVLDVLSLGTIFILATALLDLLITFHAAFEAALVPDATLKLEYVWGPLVSTLCTVTVISVLLVLQIRKIVRDAEAGEHEPLLQGGAPPIYR